MKFVILTIVTLVCNNFYLLFINSSDQVINFAYDASQYCLFIFLFGFIFTLIPRQDFKQRGISLVLALMFVNLLLNTAYDKLDLSLFYIQYPIGIGLFSYLIYSTLQWEVPKAIPLLKNKTYFIFKRPNGLLDFIVTMFQMPVSSFSIASDGRWYKFSRQLMRLHCVGLNTMNCDHYHAVEVGFIPMESLRSLCGIRWSLRESNCITGFKNIFKGMGIELGRFDFIPPVFAYKFFRGKYGI